MSGDNTSFASIGESIVRHGESKKPTCSVEIDEKASECIRQEYLQTIERPKWQKLMTDKASALCATLKASGWSFGGTDNPISVAVDGILREVSKPVFTIGRSTRCDIPLSRSGSNNCFVSRLQAVVIVGNNPNGQHYFIVIDFWSLMGTTIKAPNSPDSTSDSKKRSLLMLGSVPGAKIQITCENTKFDVKFYARECVVCCERPREVRFGCGHSISCNHCASQLTDCPICRTPIRALNESMGFNTNVA